MITLCRMQRFSTMNVIGGEPFTNQVLNIYQNSDLWFSKDRSQE